MSKKNSTPPGKNPELWTTARKQVGFVKHAIIYIIVNLFLWTLWYFTNSNFNPVNRLIHFPWPVIATLGWGIGLALNFVNAYLFSSFMSTENTYQKLLNNKSIPVN